MFLAALLVGLLVAYYFGVRPGVIAGGAAAALFFLAVVVPGTAALAYVLVCAGVAGVVVLGPKLKRPDSLAAGKGGFRSVAFQAIRTVRRAVKQVTGDAADKRRDRNRRG